MGPPRTHLCRPLRRRRSTEILACDGSQWGPRQGPARTGARAVQPRASRASRGAVRATVAGPKRLLFTWQEGTITTMEFVEQVRGAVPDPLMD
jgi:hypothetical protein